MSLRNALRGLRRTPGFTVLVVGMLSIGIGSVTAMYGVIDQVLLEPLPVDDQDRLVVGWNYHRVRAFDHFPFMYDAFSAVEERVEALEGIAAHDGWAPSEVLLTSEGNPHALMLSRVLGDFFGLLGVEPVVGRTLRLEDDMPGADQVAVISEAMWETHFGRDEGAIGSTLLGRRSNFRIVGVVPRDFDYPRGTDLWTPLKPFHPDWDARIPLLELDIVGRLGPGSTREMAAEQISGVYPTDPELSRIYGDTEPMLYAFQDVALGRLRPTLILIFAGATLVLLVAAINVANLVLIRSAGREPATALRIALGADRRRLFGEAIADATALGLLAGVGGALVSVAAIRIVLPWAPQGLPRLGEVVAFDGRVFIVSLAVTTALATLATLVPVHGAGSIDPARLLSRAGRGSAAASGRAARSGLVAAQIGLAVWVLAAGALLVRSVRNLQSLDLGFQAEELTLVALDAPSDGELGPDVSDRYDAVGERLSRYPDIVGSTVVLAPPLAGIGAFLFVVFKEDQPREAALQENPFTILEVVQPSYFDVVGVPILRGRAIGASDVETTQLVIVVNEAAARALWPQENPLGKRIRAPLRGFGERLWTVVGVAGNTRYAELEEERASIFFPMNQLGDFIPRTMLVRTRDAHDAVLPRVRQAFQEVDGRIQPKSASLVSTTLAEPLARPLLGARLLTMFAAVTLLLAFAGVYGVMAYAVRTRRKEIGVRLACGATPRDAAFMVVRRTAWIALLGGSIGAGAAIVSGRALESLLYAISPTDPITVAASAAAVALGALSASWWPARRAASLDAAEVLRQE